MQEAVLAQNQDLRRVESSAGKTGPVNIPGWRCERDDIVLDDDHHHAHERI